MKPPFRIPLDQIDSPRLTVSNTRRQLVQGGLHVATAAALLPLVGLARAQGASWPVKPVQFLVGAPAGGAPDTVARKIAELFPTASAGGTMIVQNRPGAAGLLQAQLVTNSAPDGLTLGYIHSGHVVLQAMEGKLNVLKDLTPITMFNVSQFCIGVAADSPYQTLEELLSAIEKSPNKFNYGAGGNGSPGHIAWEKLVALRPKLQVTQVPFKGAIESVLAVAQKSIDFVCGVLPAVLSLAKTGKLRILAVTGRKRSVVEPGIPTVAEAIKQPQYNHESWGAVFGPAGMSAALVSQIDSVVRKVATDPGYVKFVIEQGGETLLSDSPAALTKYVETEVQNYVALMTKLGLRKV